MKKLTKIVLPQNHEIQMRAVGYLTMEDFWIHYPHDKLVKNQRTGKLHKIIGGISFDANVRVERPIPPMSRVPVSNWRRQKIVCLKFENQKELQTGDLLEVVSTI